MRTAFCTPLLVASCLALGAVATAQKDKIFWTDGTMTERVKVTGLNLREVTFKRGSREETKSADRVAELDVEKVKDVYRRAYGASSAERVAQFLRIADSEDDPFLKQFGYREAAKILLDDAEYRDAFDTLKDLQDKCPDSAFFPMLYRAKIDYYLARGSKDAGKVAAEYETAAQTQGFPEGFVIEANFYRALSRALAGEIDTGQLRSEMTGIARKADPNFPVVASRARLAVANSLRKEGKIEDAAPEYAALIDADDTAAAVLPSAWLGMGHVHAAKGNPADKEPYHAALLAFLRVFLDENASRPDKAEALYFGHEAAKKWGGEGAARYARVLKGLLLNRYGESEWAKK